MFTYRRNLGYIIAIFLMINSPQFVEASKPMPAENPAQSTIDHAPVLGSFVIYTLQEGKWMERGKLGYDRFFTTKKLDLSPYLEPGNVKIRVVEKGGEAAHIDSVLLEGKSPVAVSGIDEKKKMNKLSGSDFDVIDAYGKSIELEFVLPRKEKSLAVFSLTGRIEGKRISRIPFHYPLANLYHPITEHSQFYDYKLGSNHGRLKIDGNISDEMLGKSLFAEHSRTGSGHPSGTTYGWVRNDHKNLYVAIDFTPDDTMDGAKDYTKVYVKTDSGIREFKVSVPEQKWGKPGFSYTDKVTYQHKVYEFAIPLSELGIRKSEMKKDAPLQLAFAAYGTAAPPTLSITKTDAPDPVSVGANLTYTMIVTNNSPAGGVVPNLGIIGSALSTALVDTLPVGVNFVSATPSQGTCGGVVAGTVTCQLGTILPAGATATVTLVVSPTAVGTITNSATVSATGVWGVPTVPVAAQAITTVNAAPVPPSPPPVNQCTNLLILNSPLFYAGDTLSLGVQFLPWAGASVADAYVSIGTPDNRSLSLQLGNVFAVALTPMVSDWTVVPFNSQIFSYTFTGNEPTGAYRVQGFFTPPGTFKSTGPVFCPKSFMFIP